MLGPDAPEIVQGLAIAVKCGATKKQFDQTVGIHPSAAEEFVTMREKYVRPPKARRSKRTANIILQVTYLWSYDREDQRAWMAKPRSIKKLAVPAAALRGISDDHGYAILLLGLLRNEANWLKKLLVKAVSKKPTDRSPTDRRISHLRRFSATTLAGKST